MDEKENVDFQPCENVRPLSTVLPIVSPKSSASRHKKKSRKYDRIEFRDIYGKNWALGRYLGEGGFGRIHVCYRLNTSDRIENAFQRYAVKLEPYRKVSSLKHEICVYKMLLQNLHKRKSVDGCNSGGFPKLISYGVSPFPRHFWRLSHNKNGNVSKSSLLSHRFMIIEKLHCSLSSYLQKYKKLVTRRIFKIALSVSLVLEFLHSLGYSHRDIKPSNIMYNSLDEPCLIDYGLSTRFRFPKYQKNQSLQRSTSKYTGTLPYASIDSHYGYVTANSDYESLIYTIFVFSGFKLPWAHERNPKKVLRLKEFHKKDLYRNMLSNLNSWYKGVRKKRFDQLIEYLSQLKYSDVLDYSYVHSLFVKLITKR